MRKAHELATCRLPDTARAPPVYSIYQHVPAGSERPQTTGRLTSYTPSLGVYDKCRSPSGHMRHIDINIKLWPSILYPISYYMYYILF
jgi:hypothetical protein